MAADRLLILDDDAAVGETLARIAGDEGLDSRLTTDADEFFAVFDRWNPTHVTVDLVMPGMDGVEVLRLLAARECRARVIISSGVGGRILDAARRSAAEHGLDIVGVLSKPFMSSTFRKLLRADASGATANAALAPSPKAGFEVTETGLRQALRRSELYVEYQPKIQCRTGVVAGFEALVRWRHPVAGTVMPDAFIRRAESWNLIDELTRQVSDQALRWLSLAPHADRLSISINISARTLVDFQLGELAWQLCRELRIEPARLIFELTETSAMQDPVAALDLLTRLRVKGFQLSIDDFGTGYSSMVQLVRLPFSEIKVDKSFVMAATQSREARTVTKSVVDLGHSLGLQVVAEGVEDAQTLAFLNEVGCDLAQGYFIARPMSDAPVVEWLRDRHARRSTAAEQVR